MNCSTVFLKLYSIPSTKISSDPNLQTAVGSLSNVALSRVYESILFVRWKPVFANVGVDSFTNSYFKCPFVFCVNISVNIVVHIYVYIFTYTYTYTFTFIKISS